MSDLIDRQAAIARAVPLYLLGRKVMIVSVSELENLPSAQPERKTGQWIEVDDYYNRISGRCSICGWEALLYETDVVGMDFCPNCGADMRGGK